MTTERPEAITVLEPGIRRVLAPNPSPMTHWGTNSYIVGEGRVAVIDPGPSDRATCRRFWMPCNRAKPSAIFWSPIRIWIIHRWRAHWPKQPAPRCWLSATAAPGAPR